MFELLIKLFLFTNIFAIILSSELTLNSTKLSEDILVSCDQKSNIGENTTNRENLCKVECFTSLKNPGICQIHTLNPCRTLDSTIKPVKCHQISGQNSMFQSICCPFRPEKQVGSVVEKPIPAVPNEKRENCGKRPNIAAIVGGIDAQPNTWPWVVSIYERPNPRNPPRFICGAAIISQNYILSAAHCFVRSDGEKIRANRFLYKVGAHRLSDKNIRFGEISEIVVHKNYKTIQNYFDIALIRVRNKIEFLPTVGPICLPKSSLFLKESFIGRTSKLVGWGATRFGGTVSDGLQEVDVDIIDNRDCNRNYSRIPGHESAFPRGINEQHICAGYPTGGKDSCQGDSGGPLAVEVDGQWYELGIVSFGYKCAEPGFPGIALFWS